MSNNQAFKIMFLVVAIVLSLIMLVSITVPVAFLSFLSFAATSWTCFFYFNKRCNEDMVFVSKRKAFLKNNNFHTNRSYHLLFCLR